MPGAARRDDDDRDDFDGTRGGGGGDERGGDDDGDGAFTPSAASGSTSTVTPESFREAFLMRRGLSTGAFALGTLLALGGGGLSW